MLGLIVALAIDPVLNVYETATGGGDAMQALRDAARALALTSAVAGLAGVGLAFAQRAIESRVQLPRPDRRLVAGAAVVGLVLAVGVTVALSGRVEARLNDANERNVGDNGSRIGSLDPEERLDYWRVSIDMFQASPGSAREPVTSSTTTPATATLQSPPATRTTSSCARWVREGRSVSCSLPPF